MLTRPKISEILIINYSMLTQDALSHCDTVQAECKAASQVLVSVMSSQGLSWEENVVIAHSTLWKSFEHVEKLFHLFWNTCGTSNGDRQRV